MSAIKKSFKLIFVIFLATTCDAVKASVTKRVPSLIVRTTEGPIQGKYIMVDGKPVQAFLGVPYAKPPTGKLRFKKTLPPDRRKHALDTRTMPPACPQYATGPYPWYDGDSGQSEDCLYLNIWVPEEGETKKSVLFNIFGGGSCMGSIRKDVYQGHALATVGDVIVVTISYRLGAFGFLVSGTDNAPGNVGVYDVVQGLRWIYNNIEFFGGDKDSITLMGESDGATMVGLLMISPLTSGLYKRAIMQSGSPAYLTAENNTQNFAFSQRLAENCNCADENTTMWNDPEKVINCLRGIDASILAKETVLLLPLESRVFVPQFGDTVLPTNPRKDIIQGNIQHVELLIGNVKDEGSFYLSTQLRKIFGFFGEKSFNLTKTFSTKILKSQFRQVRDPDALVNYYLGGLREDDYARIRKQTYDALGDVELLCPTLYLAETVSRTNKVYYYNFVHRPSNTPWADWQGVAHFDEVQFVFGQPILHPQDYSLDEVELSAYMVKMWAEFAKTGCTRAEWPVFNKEDPKAMVIDNVLDVKYANILHHENCNFLRTYFGF